MTASTGTITWTPPTSPSHLACRPTPSAAFLKTSPPTASSSASRRGRASPTSGRAPTGRPSNEPPSPEFNAVFLLGVTVSTKPPHKEEGRFLKRLDGICPLAAPAPLSPRWLCGDGSRKGGCLRHLIVRRAPNGAGANRPDRPHSPDPSNINLAGADDQPAATVRRKSLRVSGAGGADGTDASFPTQSTEPSW